MAPRKWKKHVESQAHMTALGIIRRLAGERRRSSEQQLELAQQGHQQLQRLVAHEGHLDGSVCVCVCVCV